jgi:hypothetical protein
MRVLLRQQAIARIHRDWRSLPEPLEQSVPLDHPYARDLDLIGHGSLQQLLDTTQTPAGRRTLLQWLTEGAPETEIGARQRIAINFAGADQWREDLAAAGTWPRPVPAPESRAETSSSCLPGSNPRQLNESAGGT